MKPSLLVTCSSGDEADIQDYVPITPPHVFNRDTGQLTPRDESQLSPRQRKQLNKKLRGASPLVSEAGRAEGEDRGGEEAPAGIVSALPGREMFTDFCIFQHFY